MSLRYKAPLFTWEGMAYSKFIPTHTLGRSTRGKIYRKRSESLNSCLLRAKPWSARGIAFNQELAPLSLDWLTSRSRSGERVELMPSIFSLSRALLSDWWCLLSSSVELSPGAINVLCDLIESTRAVVIDFEAANCCGASALKSGMPRPPWAVVKVTSRRTSLGRGSDWPNKVERSKSSIACWIGSTWLHLIGWKSVFNQSTKHGA